MADLTLGNKKMGFSVKSFMAIAFTITACVLTINKTMGIEAFMALASTVVYAYFRKEEPNKGGNNEQPNKLG